MNIGQTLRVTTRKAWRAWLEKNHARKKEIWLVYATKKSGKGRVPYSDAVEEALCFGWIDGTMKSIDENYFAQRFSPRRSAKSQLSETNKERVRRMIRAGLMTPAGLEKIRDRMSEKFVPPPDIVQELKRDPKVWKNFQRFPKWYQRVRVGWLDMSRGREEIFRARLRYFLKMTAQNKRYGQVHDSVTKDRRTPDRRAKQNGFCKPPSFDAWRSAEDPHILGGAIVISGFSSRVVSDGSTAS